MGDSALAEFLGQYVTWALEVYLQTKQGVQAMAPFNPFYGVPRAFGMGGPGAWPSTPPAPRQAQAPAAPPAADDVAALRRELEELKKILKKKPGR